MQLVVTNSHPDPEIFILLSGISMSGDILLKPARAAMARHYFNACSGHINVQTSLS
ncbi:hypothetical protein [Arenibacter algicola]|uniref:hypothetical protein n=1 Tax=Arenibacter algicola TaxID=616991 RepID=UPI0012FD1000|nr:hypothetical protein [Arenibacter algicola]MDX1767679.1 hypothetical protein [Arenibacter troitsensis]